MHYFKASFLSALLILFGTTSCKKDIDQIQIDPNDPNFFINPIFGIDSGYLAGNCIKYVPNKGSQKFSFNTAIQKKTNGKYSINFWTHSEFYIKNYNIVIPIERIVFNDLKLVESEYTFLPNKITSNQQDILPLNPFFFRHVDDGVLVATYKLRPNNSTFFKITKVDKSIRLVEGTFCLYFVRQNLNEPSKYSDEMYFYDGKFKARIPD